MVYHSLFEKIPVSYLFTFTHMTVPLITIHKNRKTGLPTANSINKVSLPTI